MIQFDNGPPGGDYARYIDGLLAQRMPVASMDQDGFIAPPSPREGVTSAAATRVAAQPKPPVAAAALSPAQAGAIATTMMANARDRTADGKAALDVLGVVVGGILVLLGIFVDRFGFYVVVLGVGLIVAMFKRIGQRRAQRSAAPRTAQTLIARATARRAASKP